MTEIFVRRKYERDRVQGKRIGNNEWIYGYLRQTGHENIEKPNGQYIKTVKYYQIQYNKNIGGYRFDDRDFCQEKQCRQYREFIFATEGKDIDDITATQYVRIQQEGYLRGRKEEQEKAKQFIEENSIPKKKIEDKIKEYEELVEDFEKTDNSGRFKRTKSIDYYKLEAFKELLEENKN